MTKRTLAHRLEEDKIDQFSGQGVQARQAERQENTMGAGQSRYGKEEFARRDQAIYEKRVRPQVEEGNTGRVVAIDVETEAFEVADDPIGASDRLFARFPDAQPWLVRIGHQALHRFGVAQAGGLT